MKKRSAHLMRILIENYYTFSPYRGARLAYAREYDPNPVISLDLTTKIDIDYAISQLIDEGILSKQEQQMLGYVKMDGRLSRRDISSMIQEHEGYYVNQRTISRRLESAYSKIQRKLGFEYADTRVFQIIAKKLGRPEPYILNDDEIEKVQQQWEKSNGPAYHISIVGTYGLSWYVRATLSFARIYFSTSSDRN